LLYDENDPTMDNMVAGGDVESQDNNNGGVIGSNLVATAILHPMVCNLAFVASNKAHNHVLKQAAALKSDTNTEFLKKIVVCKPRKELGS
jgi:hypothetical protein